MNKSLQVKKVLNNNVVIVTDASSLERIVIGKGIGFGKKQGAHILPEQVDKLFVLKDENEQEQYKTLLTHIDEKVVEVINDVIVHIRTRFDNDLNEHIHVALTDHITFAIKRLEQGLDIKNPFLTETQTLYPKEYTVAEEVIEVINKSLRIHLPEGEIGFVALHIHSAITNKSVTAIKKHSQLINTLMQMVQHALDLKIDTKSINYLRLVRHLRHAIERISMGDIMEEQEKLAKVLKEEYPICYNLAWKLIKVMQNALNKPVPHAEAVYLTMHLQRLSRYDN
ncbi:glucose PTS transporter transcription antiterminator GlcT [Fictibacillus barbaricus]|uniref:PRD domain-containing protein n=1 Tax=Fictibacillus barbaricus TaxID=182136 RepID=A0ABS2ZGV5_9BACL|nr:PRD domain-containing protein [Fictibacillus barbaricus]MBN3547417.1 PRD domain-containing protein [Fictibacillus barbaricus]GGB48822.1 PtsGHI operon antiterminator [Fictibacillus barbaricus]